MLMNHTGDRRQKCHLEMIKLVIISLVYLCYLCTLYILYKINTVLITNTLNVYFELVHQTFGHPQRTRDLS